ncbi:MAG TPA: hypothetical protein DFR83_09730 [Deltaproteobacteria bacterium]|nr:hypothetical protein [Deltaproteobacteria bacterium]
MPAPAAGPTVALALLTAPLPEPEPCALPPRLSALLVDVFDRGLQPGQPGIQDRGGPFQAHQLRMQAQLSDRFGELASTEQLDRQLGRR